MQVCHFQHLLRPFDKNEPSRFLGEGVFFKAKLIGILEVAEARGDRMCQEALADLKMAIRAAGEHKQRISVHVAIDGLRLRDEKSGDSLYHHPVHKISFIAQDMSDSRAFGYIFGSPDTGHRFFGIKTDKAASQVVITMRDLFQVVFELKKKEIELAKQQLENKALLTASRYISSANLEAAKNGENSSTRTRLGGSVSNPSTSTSANISNAAGTSGGSAVAELVDLVQELNSLQRGLHQMERLTPTDPFGDSFTGAPVPGFLPPPPSSSRGPRTTASLTSDGGSPFSPPPARTHFNFDPPASLPTVTTSAPAIISQTSPTTTVSPGPSYKSPRKVIERGSVERRSIETPAPIILDNTASVSPVPLEALLTANAEGSSSAIFDVFTELDPLGTGRSKPYVDKKHFFQELKNPPKKVLKDLVGGTAVAPSDGLFQPKFDSSPKAELLTTLTSVGRHSGGSVSIAKPQPANQLFNNSTLFTSDPFAETDPFDNTDPFSESLRDDPFVGGSLDFNKSLQSSEFITPPSKPNTNFGKETTLPETRIGLDQSTKIKFLCAALKSDIVPLQVSLPLESIIKSPKLIKQNIIDKSTIRQRPHSGRQRAQPSPSPPPPLPPKKPIERAGDINVGPPLPLPARKRQTTSQSTTSSINTLSWLSPAVAPEEDYLVPAPMVPRRPAPSPTAPPTAPSPGLDITLAQLLTCGMDELAGRLRMPAEVLSRMTLAQLTGHLHDYIQTGSNGESAKPEVPDQPPEVAERPPLTLDNKNIEFDVNFEDNFTAGNTITTTSAPATVPAAVDAFEVNFDNFNKSNKSSYDRYAVFREIEAEGLKPANDLVQNQEEHDSLSSQPDLPCDTSILNVDDKPVTTKPISNIKFDSLSMIAPVSSAAQNTKLEELKSVINSIQKTSLSPTPDIDVTLSTETKIKDVEVSKGKSSATDRYAALRDLSTVDEIPRPLSAELSEALDISVPLQVPKERKKSDEKSDGFDHSDFFDCIDNSLSLVNPEDAFRKSPLVVKDIASPEKVPEPIKKSPIQLTAPQPLVSGSISDVASGSSPEIVLTGGRESADRDRERDSSRRSSGKSSRPGDAWTLLPGRSSPPAQSEDGASPWSSDSKESPPQQVKCWSRNYPETSSRRHRRNPKTNWHTRQTSSSSRDVSPWEEEPPLPPRDAVPHSRYRERRESIGSCERRDSGGSRERRDSGSGRDRDRDRQRRRHKSRDEDDEWSGERGYSGSRRLSPCTRSSSREMRRERGWPDDERRRPDERGYSTVGRRESSRRRGEPPWQGDEAHSCTMGNRSWRRSGSSGEGDRRSGGGSSGAERSRNRLGPSSSSSHRPRPARHRAHRSPFQDDFPRDHSPSPPPLTSPPRSRHQHHFFDDFNQSEADSPMAPKNNARFRFSNDFSEKDSPKSQTSPFENDFVETTSSVRKSSKYDGTYASLEKQSPVTRVSSFNRFKYEKELSSENLSGSPASIKPQKSPPNSSRSLFEDDFSPEPRNGILRTSDANGDHCRNTIPEGEEVVTTKEERTEKIVGFDFGSKDGAIPENRRSQKHSSNKSRSKPELDIKKSESVNIFARDSDPFDGDDFFSCTASDKPKKDNWQGDFASFDDI
ncbi:DAB adaptor protein isoform X2 [Arctopsyche grandis]|uniref:DAB adaptor protein isoform X2 n=1 Tax=Arctopsyche grandis TaxID=121162 RepID=UPI00406D97EE